MSRYWQNSKSWIFILSLCLPGFSSSYSQDSVTSDQNLIIENSSTIKVDTLKRIDTIVVIHKDTIYEKNSLENPFTERENIKRLYREADSLHERYLLSDRVSSLIKSDSVKTLAYYKLAKWTSDFPYEAKTEKLLKLSKVAGFFQIASGITGILICIIHSNSETKFTFKIPQYNSSMKVIGEETKSASFENKWTFTHTLVTILSAGLFASGIITINF